MELVFGVAAAAAAAISAVFVWLQVAEMRRQTALQREIMEAANQPYVWADVRIQSMNGLILEFVLGNSGTTVATDVKVTIDPPFLDTESQFTEYLATMHEKLAKGIASLTPGHQHAWMIADSRDLMNRDDLGPHVVRIDCRGPFGPVPTNEYVIDFRNFRETTARHTGDLRDVVRAIDKLTKELPKPS
jgi:hypothetical protein